MESTLLDTGLQASSTESLKHLLNMYFMLNCILGINQKTIRKCCHKLVQLTHQGLVDKALKSSWSISETKGHHMVFIVPISHPEDG